MGGDLAALDERVNDLLDAPVGLHKPLPPDAEAVPLRDVGSKGWNILADDLVLPAMVLHEDALAHNVARMAAWCEANGVSLAPHGKTTMAPQLWRRQLAAGAWGITVAAPSQLAVARRFGVPRVLLANQLVDPRAIAWLSDELDADDGFTACCLVDSAAGVDVLDGCRLRAGARRRLPVLVEVGAAGRRAGARTRAEALDVATAVQRSGTLELAGVECFEGVLHGEDGGRDDAAVERLLETVLDVVAAIQGAAIQGAAEPLPDEMIVSAGGSVYFDLVPALRASGARVVVRSGCYLTHDHGVIARTSPLDGPDGFRPAIEVWASVLSRPERGLALIGMGKRDVSFDIDLPVPLRVAHDGAVRPVDDMAVFELNDQHAFVRLSPSDDLAVGDKIGFGVSHPCTTFDRWPLVLVVDGDLTVVDALRTFF